MSVLKGDYIGFSYNSVHSSDLGIVRTSDGSRFNENLLPTMQDKTVQVPGGDGTYYFGSYYTQRQFNISFAFDSLTEEQVARIKSHFGDKGVHDLIFDEVPYKVYKAKVTGTATIKHIPFAEGTTNRLYKGEGSIQFTCYEPFARSKYKWLNEYKEEEYLNKIEWAMATKMKEKQGQYDKSNPTTGKIPLYNPGDIETNFILEIPFGKTSGTIPSSSIKLGSSTLIWEKIEPKGEDDGICIDSKMNLIYGYKDSKKTNNIYNEYLIDGAFFKIPQGESELIIGTELEKWFGGSFAINYNYYYF